jgi:hypothetical protein
MTDIIEEIRAALLLANPNDLEAFRHYLEWMKIRQKITSRFYFRAHWIDCSRRRQLEAGQQYHWI